MSTGAETVNVSLYYCQFYEKHSQGFFLALQHKMKDEFRDES